MNIQTKLLERLRSAYSNATSCELRSCGFGCCWSCISGEMEEEEEEEDNGREEERGRKGESGNIGAESEVPMPYNFFQPQQPIHSSLCFNNSPKLYVYLCHMN